ncbi:MAG TPA: HEAT repeat domain-containing protein [Planctomycetes bacterium]|nr:HEAT repeat domain-containing protein [Planctomycetota bacterium]
MQSFQAAIEAHSLGVEDRPRLRESLAEDFFHRLQAINRQRPFFSLEIEQKGFSVDGRFLKGGKEIPDLSSYLLGQGIRTITFHAGVSRRTVLDLIGILGSARSMSESSSSPSKCLWARVLAHSLPGISVRILQDLPPKTQWNPFLSDRETQREEEGIHGRASEIQRLIRTEEHRVLPLELGIALLSDLVSKEAGEQWEEEETRELEACLSHLIQEKKIRETLHLLDRADQCLPRDQKPFKILTASFDRAIDETYLNELLAVLPPSPDPSIAAFLLRIGPRVAPILLGALSRSRTPALHALLETLVQVDPTPFLQTLKESDDPNLQETALEYLIETPTPIPTPLLRSLANSETPSLRTRSVEALFRFGEIEEEEALHLTEDPIESIRIQALLWLSKNPLSFQNLEAFLLDFSSRERGMGIRERKAAFQVLAAASGKESPQVLDPWIHQSKMPWRRKTDRENQICAIQALGTLSHLGEIRDYLEKLLLSCPPHLCVWVQKALSDSQDP